MRYVDAIILGKQGAMQFRLRCDANTISDILLILIYSYITNWIFEISCYCTVINQKEFFISLYLDMHND